MEIGLAFERLRDERKIAERAGRVLGTSKVGKHFSWSLDQHGAFRFQRNEPKIAEEAALDGIYVVRTSVEQSVLDTQQTVAAYKSLSVVERAFRQLKTSDLKIRPIHHRKAERVRAHVLLCMLAYYLEWLMRARLAPILFDDHDKPSAEAQRTSPVAKAEPSEPAKRKAKTKQTDDDLPVHSFRSLLAHLACLTKNTVRFGKQQTMEILAKPTSVQQRAIDLLGAKQAP